MKKNLIFMACALLFVPIFGVEIQPETINLASLQGLPQELSVMITQAMPSAKESGVFNIPELAKALSALASTNKQYYELVNDPSNMIAILNAMPSKIAGLSLTKQLPNMRVMKSPEVQAWIKGVTFEPIVHLDNALRTIDEVYEALKTSNPDDIAYFEDLKAKNLAYIKEFLKNHNIDLNVGAPLSYALRIGDPELVKLLLAGGANPNRPNYENITPIMTAVSIRGGLFKDKNVEVIKLLLDAGANPNAQDRLLFSPLMLVAMDIDKTAEDKFSMPTERGVEIIKLLLRHGADKNLKNKHGATALDLAARPEYKEALSK